MGTSSGKTLTFAVSGERGACCGGARRSAAADYTPQIQAPIPGPSTTRSPDGINYSTGRGLDLRGVYEDRSTASASTMEVPRVSLSRASSSSSPRAASCPLL